MSGMASACTGDLPCSSVGDAEAMSSKYDEMMKAKKFLPFHLGYLPEKIVQKAKEELNETDEVRGPCIEQLRKMVLAEKKLKVHTTDEYLLQFLRARKFDVKKAHALVLNKFKLKKDYSDIYTKFDWDLLMKGLSYGPLATMPFRDEDGCAVLIIKLASWKCDELPVLEGFQALTSILLHSVQDPVSQVSGIRVLVDVKGCSLKQMRCVTPRYIHLLSKALRNHLPIRFKGIHIYNESTIFQYLWSVLKLFLSEKINKRVHFHGDNQKNLHKHIPKAILPAEYGGDNVSFDYNAWCVAEKHLYVPMIEELLQCGYSS